MRSALGLLCVLLVTASLGAVPIRSQTNNPDGFTIVTSTGVSLQVKVTNNGGGSWTAQVLQDGVIKATTTVTNPTVSQIETWVQTNLGPFLGSGAVGSVCVGTVNPAFNVAVHFVSLSPFALQLMTSNCNLPIPLTWWAQ